MPHRRRPVRAAGDPLRLGVVGLGRAASSMLPSLRAHPQVHLTAAADLDPAARARFCSDFGGAAFTGAAELCASGLVDAVYIATPHQCHAADVATAAAHGIHVIVEKPMALTLGACDAMNAAADAAGIVLVVGHTHAYDPVVRTIRAIVASGRYGALRSITNLAYTDFLYRPRRPEELDTSAGGGIFYNQLPHQIDIVRTLDDGALRSVKAIAGVWDAARRTEGALSALLEFESGVAATLVYSGYDHFDSDELTFGIASSGAEKIAEPGATRRRLRASAVAEVDQKAASGFGGRGVRAPGGPQHQPHFGMLLVSCDGADLRPSPNGVYVYDDDGMHEVVVPLGRAFPDKDAVIDDFFRAISEGTPPPHDGRWGRATVEATLAVVQSARERREIVLAPTVSITP